MAKSHSEDSDQLYVSIGKPVYRGGKENLLRSQESLLRILKRFAALKLLWREKKLLRNKVIKMLSETTVAIADANNHLPVPKAIQKRMEQKKKEEERLHHQQEREEAARKREEERSKREEELVKKRKVQKTKNQSIDDELREIQAKLAALNG